MQEFGIQLMGRVVALKEQLRSQRGQGMVEYGLILALVSVAAIAGLVLLKGQISTVFTDITNAFTSAGVD